MAKINPLQTRFSAGEISPRFLAQSDVEGYRAGLAECDNFIVTSQGPAYRRGGFAHIDSLDGDYSRVFPFQLDVGNTPDEALPVVVNANGYVEIYAGSSDNTGPNIVFDGDFESGSLRPWVNIVGSTFSGTTSWVGGAMRLQPVANPADYIGMSKINTIVPADGNAVHRVTVKTKNPLQGVDLTGFSSNRYPPIKVLIGTASGLGDKFDSGWVERATEVTGTFNMGVVGPSTVPFYITVLAKGGDYSTSGTVYGVQYRDIDSVYVGKVIPGAQHAILHTYDQTDIIGMRTYMHPSEKSMYILTGRKAPKRLRYDGTTPWVLEDVTFTAKPASWAVDDWPTCMTFAGGRMWMSGVRAKPNTVWGSKSGTANYHDFTIGATADDALEIEMTRRGSVRWLGGNKDLLVGTATTEYIITSDGGVIIPGDYQVSPQSSNGSRATEPVPMGNSVLYVSPDGRKVYSADYKWTDQAWSSRDLTFSSEHITKGNTISQVCSCKNPEKLVWALTDAGKLLCCTYDSFTGQMGWHNHSTDGSFVSICSLEKDGQSLLYAIASRTDADGFRTLRLEKYDENHFLDASTRMGSSPSSTVLTGLSHLSERTVGVLVDGAVHPDVVVDSSGAIVLQYGGNTIEVGLNYSARLTTLPADFGAQNGSAAPMKKRWVKVGVKLVDSAYPIINGERPPTRVPSTPMGLRDVNLTGGVLVFGGSPDETGSVTVEQDLPLPCMVAGIFGELDQNQL